mmetsp:Transcript_92769/g.262367  ORF Transcript_92769/g.262367 Transcript_92769/m.262367 type:complete len:209 (-) Transcript_92769:727-1353(-)
MRSRERPLLASRRRDRDRDRDLPRVPRSTRLVPRRTAPAGPAVAGLLRLRAAPLAPSPPLLMPLPSLSKSCGALAAVPEPAATLRPLPGSQTEASPPMGMSACTGFGSCLVAGAARSRWAAPLVFPDPTLGPDSGPTSARGFINGARDMFDASVLPASEATGFVVRGGRTVRGRTECSPIFLFMSSTVAWKLSGRERAAPGGGTVRGT